jgi:8-oxo-dGTP diphosphatase
MMQKEEVENLYGNKVRVRACGICINEDKILLINHKGVGEKGSLWAPPGGGVEYGESPDETLVREYKEETGLRIAVKEFLFVNELFVPPLQAIELFFKVEVIGGQMKMGSDPEMKADRQIIQELRYWSFNEIEKEDPILFHSILRNHKTQKELLSLSGYFKNIKS